MKTLLAPALLALVLLAAGTTATQAQRGINIRTNTAGELAELCGANPREPGADARINFCHGFAQGAIDVARQHLGDRKLFCFPPSPPSRNATMQEFVSWVRGAPNRRDTPSVNGLFQFLGERFPCK